MPRRVGLHPASHAGNDVKSNYADGGHDEGCSRHIQPSDCGQAVRPRIALGMERDLEKAASPAEGLDVSAPCLSGNEQSTYQASDAKTQEDHEEPESHCVITKVRNNRSCAASESGPR